MFVKKVKLLSYSISDAITSLVIFLKTYLCLELLGRYFFKRKSSRIVEPVVPFGTL